MRQPRIRLTPKKQNVLRAARLAALDMKNKMFGEMYVHAVEQRMRYNNPAFLLFLKALEQPPVHIETFLDSEQFFGATDLTLWPEVRQAAIDMCQDWWKGPRVHKSEAVLCGATSTGKSELCKVVTAYYLHILACMKNPQEYYGLPSATTIIMVIQAAKPHVTKKIIYTPLRNYIETIPWFREHLRPNKYIESEMYFENKNLRVVPGGSDADTILGEAIIHAVLDEVNFMQVVKQSKKAEVQTGRPGVYDQAQSIYTAITRRRKSRFISTGPQIGAIMVSSSTRYKGDFTDKRCEAIKDQRLRTAYIYNKAQFEAWPSDRYSGETFRLLVENEAASDIRVLNDDESAPAGARVISIPIEYRQDFIDDPSGALRDIIGHSVNAINPFFRQRDKVTAMFANGINSGLRSFLEKDNVELAFDGMPRVVDEHVCRDPGKRRYVHIDLAINECRVGISMLRMDGYRDMHRDTGQVERLPVATIEMACTITPDSMHEIDLAEIRTWVMKLKTKYGYPIVIITYDGWESIESRQQLKKMGMVTGSVSLDRKSTPYKGLREAVNDERIVCYEQDVLEQEMFDLEYIEDKDKIDHPVNGTKDIADAVAGAYHILLTRATTWSELEQQEYRPGDDDRFDESRQA